MFSMTENAILPVQILNFKINEFAKDAKFLIRSALNVIKMDVKSVKKDLILKERFVNNNVLIIVNFAMTLNAWFVKLVESYW